MEDYLAWKWYRIFGYVNKLRWVYETDPEEIDVPDGYRGEPRESVESIR